MDMPAIGMSTEKSLTVNTAHTVRRLAAAAALVVTASSAQASAVLWYSGDFDFTTGLANEINTSIGDARVFDDFTVTDAAGWSIDRIWSNNLTGFTGVTQASWSIRRGVGLGNGGTIVASGTSAATQTATGRTGFGMTEYTIMVSDLDIDLDPGQYWLQVTPIGRGTGRSFNGTTSGAGLVGLAMPGASFVNSPSFAVNFVAANSALGMPAPLNFSMGVAGTVSVSNAVPEPGTLLLAGLALLGAGAVRRRRA
jgi:hypothetical protein